MKPAQLFGIVIFFIIATVISYVIGNFFIGINSEWGSFVGIFIWLLSMIWISDKMLESPELVQLLTIVTAFMFAVLILKIVYLLSSSWGWAFVIGFIAFLIEMYFISVHFDWDHFIP